MFNTRLKRYLDHVSQVVELDYTTMSETIPQIMNEKKVKDIEVLIVS